MTKEEKADPRPKVRKVVDLLGRERWFESIKGKWQRVATFEAIAGVHAGYYHKLPTRRPKPLICDGCKGTPTQRDRDTNDGKLSKWPVVTNKGATWVRLCSDCMLGNISDADWREYDKQMLEMHSSISSPTADIQGLDPNFPSFTKEEKARIDKFLEDHGEGFDHVRNKNKLFAGTKNYETY